MCGFIRGLGAGTPWLELANLFIQETYHPSTDPIDLVISSTLRGRKHTTTVWTFATCPSAQTEDLGTKGEQTKLVHRHGG